MDSTKASATLPVVTPEVEEKLTNQINDLLMAGGTMGDTLDYTSRDYEALYALGHGFYQQERYQDAFRVFSFLVMHNHLEVRFLLAFASSLQMIKKWEQAIHYYSMVLAMDLANPRPMLHMCECLVGLGYYSQAREGLGILLLQSQKMELPDLEQATQTLLDFVGDKENTNTSHPVTA